MLGGERKKQEQQQRAAEAAAMPWVCNELECKKQPYYAAPGIKKPLYCFLHKQAGHVDVRNKRCDDA